jgi:hypothetical protein
MTPNVDPTATPSTVGRTPELMFPSSGGIVSAGGTLLPRVLIAGERWAQGPKASSTTSTSLVASESHGASSQGGCAAREGAGRVCQANQ